MLYDAPGHTAVTFLFTVAALATVNVIPGFCWRGGGVRVACMCIWVSGCALVHVCMRVCWRPSAVRRQQLGNTTPPIFSDSGGAADPRVGVEGAMRVHWLIISYDATQPRVSRWSLLCARLQLEIAKKTHVWHGLVCRRAGPEGCDVQESPR